MGVAADVLKLLGERGDASVEFAREGYRLSLNPIEDRTDEVGFILWREDAGGGSLPVAVGRALDDRIVLDGEPATGGEAGDIEAAIAALISGDPVAAPGGGGNERAIPTGA